jgi:hypothetical protein
MEYKFALVLASISIVWLIDLRLFRHGLICNGLVSKMGRLSWVVSKKKLQKEAIMACLSGLSQQWSWESEDNYETPDLR